MARSVAELDDVLGSLTESDYDVFVWDGDQVLAELTRDDASDANADTLATTYFNGPGTDQLLAVEDHTGEIDDVVWTLADHLGSIRTYVTLDESTGQVTGAEQLLYAAFGQEQERLGNDIGTDEILIARFTGREYDAAAELYYYRNRYYDAVLGRFLSQDPIGFAAGDANLYRYVGNGPTNATDPTGLEEVLFKSLKDAQGLVHEHGVVATGNRGTDFTQSNLKARAINPSFRSEVALKATWHHKSFNRRTGLMTMQLVDAAEHAATSHSGGWSQYINWVADVIESQRGTKLTGNKKVAFDAALNSYESANDLLKELSRRGARASVTVSQSGKAVLNVRSNGKTLISKTTRWQPSVLKTYAGHGNSPHFPSFLWSTREEMHRLQGARPVDIANEMAKVGTGGDLVVLVGHDLIVVPAGTFTTEELANPIYHADRKFRNLDPAMRQRMNESVKTFMDSRKSFEQIADEIHEDYSWGELLSNSVNEFFGRLDGTHKQQKADF